MIAVKEKDSRTTVNQLKSFPQIKSIIIPGPGIRDFENQDIRDHVETVLVNIDDSVKRELIRAIADFIASPIILDVFNFHSERREWRKALKKENQIAYELFKSNKIRSNNIARVIGILQSPELLGIESSKWYQEVEDIITVYKKDQGDGRGYDQLPLEGKITIATRLTTAARKAYKSFVEKYG